MTLLVLSLCLTACSTLEPLLFTPDGRAKKQACRNLPIYDRAEDIKRPYRTVAHAWDKNLQDAKERTCEYGAQAVYVRTAEMNNFVVVGIIFTDTEISAPTAKAE